MNYNYVINILICMHKCLSMQIIGVGSVIMMPLIGNLSDVYGRKTMLTLPMTMSIIPLGMYWRLSHFINLLLPNCSTKVHQWSYPLTLHTPTPVPI